MQDAHARAIATSTVQQAAPTRRKYHVPYVDLPALYREQRSEILAEIDAVYSTGAFILRPPVAEFERELSTYLGVEHCVGVNSGTDALYCSIEALDIGPGDEVITCAHTFVATIAAIARRGATPILVDVDPHGNMDPRAARAALTDKTRALLVVHMNGRCAQMAELSELCTQHGLHMIEDAAQAMGARHDGQFAGSFGVLAGFSLHPMKVLSVGGDGGFITCRDSDLLQRLLGLRNHGQSQGEVLEYGLSTRLDTVHAVVGRLRLTRLESWIERRRAIATRYEQGLAGIAGLQLPPAPSEGSYRDVYSSYVITCEDRDRLSQYLEQSGVECFVHWPSPIHQQPVWTSSLQLPQTEKISRTCLSIPVHPQLDEGQVDHVIAAIRTHYARRAA